MNILNKKLTPYGLFLAFVALYALGSGVFGDVLSNYFKEVYAVSAFQRGLIEFPRELPGILVIVFIAVLSSVSDIRIALAAQFLGVIGSLALGLFTPPFGLMVLFVFINSMGAHLSMPLQDSIALSLMKETQMGTIMGQYKGVATAFSMIASAVVFFGFRFGIFTFSSPIKWIFVLSALFLTGAGIFVFLLDKAVHKPVKGLERIKFLYRPEYHYYYILVIMYGVQKQIMLVYGPWVLIDLLSKKADTLAILGILGSFVGMFFMPVLGRCIDRFGIRKLLFADAYSFIGVYLFYGFLTAGFVSGRLPMQGIPVLLAYGIFIVDRMSNQMGMIRTLYLKKIAVSNSDIMPTLSLGLSLDHIVSITCAIIGGIIWGAWGPQYIFFFAAALSLVNLFVAHRVHVR